MGTGGAGSAGSGTGGAGGAGAETGGNGSGGLGTGGANSGGASGGGDSGGANSGGAGGGANSGGAGGGAASDTAKYNFETSSQGWKMAAGGGIFTSIAPSTAQHFQGTASLGGLLTAVASTTYILEIAPPTPPLAPGTIVTFHVFVPAAAAIGAIQPYLLEATSFRFTGTRIVAKNIALDGWTTVKVTVPADAKTILRLGVQFESTGAWTDTVYVDSVDW